MFYCIAGQALMEKTARLAGISFNEGLKMVKVYLHLPAVVHNTYGTRRDLL